MGVLTKQNKIEVKKYIFYSFTTIGAVMAISIVFYDVEIFKCVGFLFSQGSLAMQVKKSIS